jgi:ubiquinone/menaquinone biosynthesis C-methylase UbiE
VRLLRALDITPGQTVLDHCTGPGSNLPALSAAIGPRGRLVAMDLSGLVLRQAGMLLASRKIAADLHQADALALPYADATFDAVVHYGALNQFGPDRGTAIAEILRVARPGALVVLLDEGLAPDRIGTWWGRLLVRGNALFASRPPLDLLPAGCAPEVRWVMRGMFYEIRLRKPA